MDGGGLPAEGGGVTVALRTSLPRMCRFESGPLSLILSYMAMVGTPLIPRSAL